MKKVLITAIGSFSGKQVIQNLKTGGYKVIGCDIYPQEWISNALRVDVFYQAPLATDKKYIEFIYNVCIEQEIQYIVPLTDLEIDVLNKNRDIFRKHNIILCISDKKSIETCRNKYALYQLFKEDESILTIPTYLFSEIEYEKLQFPIVVKPYDGRSSQGLSVLQNQEQVFNFGQYHDTSRYIVQPKIEGRIITVDVVRDKNNHEVAVCRRELLRTLNGAGTSVQVFKNEKLERQAIRIAEILNVIGTVNFEFIENKENEYFFLECNPRFSGGVAFSCIAGYDFVLNHMRCFQNENLEQHIMISEMYIAREYKECITKAIV